MPRSGGAFPPMVDGLGGDAEKLADLTERLPALRQRQVAARVEIFIHIPFYKDPLQNAIQETLDISLKPRFKMAHEDKEFPLSRAWHDRRH